MQKKTNQYNWGAGIPIGIGITFAVGLALNNFILGFPVGLVMALAIASAYGKTEKTIVDPAFIEPGKPIDIECDPSI